LGHSVVSTRCCGYTCLFFGGLNTSQSCCGVFATLETLHKTLNFLTYLHCTYATDILSSKIEHHPALLWRFASLAPLYKTLDLIDLFTVSTCAPPPGYS